MKKIVFMLAFMLGLLAVAPLVLAMPDPFATLTVWPVGYEYTEAQGPLIENSPADLVIYNNDNSRILDDVWLLLVINEDAYANLGSISTNTSLTFLQEHFIEIPGGASPSSKIPGDPGDLYIGPDPGTDPAAPYAYRPNGWPGIEPDEQYGAGSVRDQLGIVHGGSLYYAVGDLDDSTGWVDHGPGGLNKGDPEYFTLTVDSDGDWRILVLALGSTDDEYNDPILNVHSPYTRSTLVIVPELGTILLALASFSGLGLYKIRHKLRK